MSVDLFIDSNIWLYSFIEDGTGKHPIATRIVNPYLLSIDIVNTRRINRCYR